MGIRELFAPTLKGLAPAERDAEVKRLEAAMRGVVDKARLAGPGQTLRASLVASCFSPRSREAFINDPEVQELKAVSEASGGGLWENENRDGLGDDGFGLVLPIELPEFASINGQHEQVEKVVHLIEHHIRPGEACMITLAWRDHPTENTGPVFIVTSQGVARLDLTTYWDRRVELSQLRKQLREFQRELRKG